MWMCHRGKEKMRGHTLPDCLRWADAVLSSVYKHDLFLVQLSNSFFTSHLQKLMDDVPLGDKVLRKK